MSTLAAPKAMAVWASWAQACILPLVAAKESPVSSFMGSASRSARIANVCPGMSPCRTAATPCPPMPFLMDEEGNPMALYLSGTGHQPGPRNGLKEWCVIHWNGSEWENHPITTSDHNYDTGSIWTDNEKWTVVIPSENSPQEWGGGGELVIWQSADKGETWIKKKQVTKASPRNHNYVREVVNGHDPFVYFWADGNPDEPSRSNLYFGNFQGDVWQLPYEMKSNQEKPLKIN